IPSSRVPPNGSQQVLLLRQSIPKRLLLYQTRGVPQPVEDILQLLATTAQRGHHDPVAHKQTPQLSPDILSPITGLDLQIRHAAARRVRTAPKRNYRLHPIQQPGRGRLIALDLHPKRTDPARARLDLLNNRAVVQNDHPVTQTLYLPKLMRAEDQRFTRYEPSHKPQDLTHLVGIQTQSRLVENQEVRVV